MSRRVNLIVVVIKFNVFLLLLGEDIFVHFFSEIILLFVFDLDLVSVTGIDAFEQSLNPPIRLQLLIVEFHLRVLRAVLIGFV